MNFDPSRFRRVILLIAATATVAVAARADSLVSCSNRGREFAPDLSITVRYADAPLAGVSVSIRKSGEDSESTQITDADGRVAASLSPGDYWLEVGKLGIYADYECFHVNDRPTGKARRSLVLEWGDMPTAVGSVSGLVFRDMPGTQGTPIERITHPIRGPLAGALVRVTSPDETYTREAEGDEKGRFDITGVPDGVYVLHVEAKLTKEGEVVSSDLLVRVSTEDRSKPMLLKLVQSVGGSRSFTLN